MSRFAIENPYFIVVVCLIIAVVGISNGARMPIDMFDAGPQRKKALETAGDIGLDLLRRHPRIERRHHDHRDIHDGEHVYRHARQAADADHSDDQTHNDDEVRIVNSELRHA